MDEPIPAVAGIPGIPPPPPIMDTVLTWIGFDADATRERIRAKGFDTFDDLATLKEKDIRDLAESYRRRTVADGRAIFGLRRIRYLIGLTHWVQDFGRVGQTPTIEGIEDAASLCAALDEAYYRADVRKIEKDQSAKLPIRASSRTSANVPNGSLALSITYLPCRACQAFHCLTSSGKRRSPMRAPNMEVSTNAPSPVFLWKDRHTRRIRGRCTSSLRAFYKPRRLNNGSSPLRAGSLVEMTCSLSAVTILARVTQAAVSLRRNG